jgi:DNA-directed RNA polymerase II subunit RPB7
LIQTHTHKNQLICAPFSLFSQVFVSNHLIPDDYEFSAAGEPAFVSADEAARVVAGAEVRLRVVGTRMDASEIFCVASMKDDYLGVISAAV